MGIPFKAVIVGGSVAGLAVAHAFDSAGIDYVVLEARDNVAPSAGAAIIMMPNGSRILDQLGIYEALKNIGQRMGTNTALKSDGTIMSSNQWPKEIEARYGYAPLIFERQQFLQSLYDQLKHKEKVHLNKKVINIINGNDSISVKCSDGSDYVGDIVVGADGVHSKVRQEMQTLVEKSFPGLIDKDKTSITAEYNCIFGVSTARPNPNLVPGDVYISCGIDHSSLLFVGKDALPQWLFCSKLDREYQGSSIPRFTEAQMKAVISEHKDFMLSKDISLESLMKTTKWMSYLALEEANHDIWTHGRIVCIGDSIHKMTPNFGQGGNQSIESAAVLTNYLLSYLSSPKSPNALSTALLKYQNSRQPRTKRFVQMSGAITRSEALATLAHTIRFLFLKPFTSEMLADIQEAMYTGAPKLDHLPFKWTDAWGEENKEPVRPVMLRHPLAKL